MAETSSSGLADMSGMPMSAEWYQYLLYLRCTLANLRNSHAISLGAANKLSPKAVETGRGTARIAAAALEDLDRKLRTMEAAGVLAPAARSEP